MHLYGRQKELILVGPPGLKEIISLQLRYSETSLNFNVKMIEWIPERIQLVIENEFLTVETIPLDHRVPCSGYLFREKPKKRRLIKNAIQEKLPPSTIYALKNGEDILNEDGTVKYHNAEVTMDPERSYSYAYCSDTRLIPNLRERLLGVDMMYHETTFMEDMKDRAHNTYHTTSKEAGELAKSARIGKLLIGHFSTRYRDLAPLLEETRSIFPPTELAIEGHEFNVSTYGK
jgi:ribonuclease Z